MRVVIGSTPTFEAQFLTSEGGVAPLLADPTVRFFRDGEQVWQEVDYIVTDLGGGKWQVVVTTPSDSIAGWASIMWEANTADGPISGQESFELVTSSLSVQSSEIESILRRRLRDVLSDPNDDTGAFFSNDEIHTMLAISGGSLNAAALEGWLMKAAYYSRFVDVEESGSSRRLSQMFKNAEAMVNFYRKAADTDSAASASSMKRGIVGRVASLRGEYVDTFGLQFLSRNGIAPSYMYVRPFATKRLITGI